MQSLTRNGRRREVLAKFDAAERALVEYIEDLEDEDGDERSRLVGVGPVLQAARADFELATAPERGAAT